MIVSAASSPAPVSSSSARANDNVFVARLDILDLAAAPDRDAEGLGTRREHGLDARHVGGEIADGTGQAMGPLRAVDQVVEELDVGEVPAWPTLLLDPVRGGPHVPAGGPLFHGIQQIATIEALDRRHGQAAKPERQIFQRGVRV